MIVFSSITKSFDGSKTAIVDLSLEINEGDLVVITGPSGAGKTTLMKLLIKEYSPSSGEITFDNQALSQIKNSEIPALRRKIGVVFQDYKLIEDMNVWENIALPLYISKQSDSEIESRVTDLLNLVGLADKAMQFPRQLSGGEAQRVSIARALSTAPKVIFADEPTGNLDGEASIKITKLLRKINELGTTLLFATHDQLVLDELDREKVIHLEIKSQETNATQANSSKQIDDEREKVKEKQDKLAKEVAEPKTAAKSEPKSPIKHLFPKLKLKIGFKKKKAADTKENKEVKESKEESKEEPQEEAKEEKKKDESN
jgi:cell division transport system ATP-binding protein